MPATTLCLINQKGGCGKSSTCFHLAGYLASRNLNVLVVDADPQGSLSQGFFGSALVENLPPEQTLAVVYDDERFLSHPARLPVATEFERIAVVPTNQHLAAHNIPDPETSRHETVPVRIVFGRIGRLRSGVDRLPTQPLSV